MAQLVKNPPTMRETWVRSLSWEDPLEKGKATHSSILAGELQGLYSPKNPNSHKESDTTKRLSLSLSRSPQPRSLACAVHSRVSAPMRI